MFAALATATLLISSRSTERKRTMPTTATQTPAEAAVIESTPNPTQEAVQMATEQNTNPESTVNPTNHVTVSSEEYDLLQQLKRERRTYVMTDKAKFHSKIMSSRRITVALRRMGELRAIAADQDVVAYIEVSNLKSVAGDKSEVSEAEMTAYLDVFYAGNDMPTLEQVKAAIK
jgi:hypothetical protein